MPQFRPRRRSTRAPRRRIPTTSSPTPTQPGIIGLVFYNAQNARVVFFECVGDRLKRLGAERSGSASTATRLPDGTIAFGSCSVRTPSCARRFELDVPRRVKPGAKARVRVLDRWGIGGISPELCIGRYTQMLWMGLRAKAAYLPG